MSVIGSSAADSRKESAAEYITTGLYRKPESEGQNERTVQVHRQWLCASSKLRQSARVYGCNGCFAKYTQSVVIAVKSGAAAAQAIEVGLRAAGAPLPRGRAGDLARAKAAWRYDDGTFMPESEKFEAYREEHEMTRPMDERARWAPTETV